jgi:hypothetical protein
VTDAKEGDRLIDSRGRTIGRVDAVYADYLLVRTRGLMPVDLYVPRTAVQRIDGGGLGVDMDASKAYDAWHRPLKRAPHD